MKLRVFVVLLLITGMMVSAQDDMTVHVVQRGDNLFRIALNYGVSLESLAQTNGITDPASIQVGQRLLIPAVSTGEEGLSQPEVIVPDSTSPTNVENPLIHTVQTGETLFTIATQYGTDIQTLAAENAILDPTLIYQGQQLVIPHLNIPQLVTSPLPEVMSSVQLSPQILIEGKTGILRLSTRLPVSIDVTFLGQRISSFTSDQLTHVIYLGIPVFTESSLYPLEIYISQNDGTVDNVSATVQVIGGSYGSEIINLLEGRDVLLNENVENAEIDLLKRATQTVTAERYFNGQFGLPAAAAMTSGFGTRRSYNGGAYDRYHSGTDFAGIPGTPILAPAPGRVVLADTLNVRGNATMLDHGAGIYTGYWHQTDIYVQVGDFVDTGQIIGTIGATGRVTGAHLHWELWVNGIAVDPMQWVQQNFY